MFHELTMFTHDKGAKFEGTFKPSSTPRGTHVIHLDTRFSNKDWVQTDIRLFLETENLVPMLAALEAIAGEIRFHLYGMTAPAADIWEEWGNV